MIKNVVGFVQTNVWKAVLIKINRLLHFYYFRYPYFSWHKINDNNKKAYFCCLLINMEVKTWFLYLMNYGGMLD